MKKCFQPLFELAFQELQSAFLSLFLLSMRRECPLEWGSFTFFQNPAAPVPSRGRDCGRQSRGRGCPASRRQVPGPRSRDSDCRGSGSDSESATEATTADHRRRGRGRRKTNCSSRRCRSPSEHFEHFWGIFSSHTSLLLLHSPTDGVARILFFPLLIEHARAPFQRVWVQFVFS